MDRTADNIEAATAGPSNPFRTGPIILVLLLASTNVGASFLAAKSELMWAYLFAPLYAQSAALAFWITLPQRGGRLRRMAIGQMALYVVGATLGATEWPDWKWAFMLTAIGMCVVAVTSLAIMALQWILRRRRGEAGKKLEFSVKDLLVVTVIVALTIPAVRLLTPSLSFNWPYVTGMAALSVGLAYGPRSMFPNKELLLGERLYRGALYVGIAALVALVLAWQPIGVASLEFMVVFVGIVAIESIVCHFVPGLD